MVFVLIFHLKIKQKKICDVFLIFLLLLLTTNVVNDDFWLSSFYVFLFISIFYFILSCNLINLPFIFFCGWMDWWDACVLHLPLLFIRIRIIIIIFIFEEQKKRDKFQLNSKTINSGVGNAFYSFVCPSYHMH